MGKGGTSWLTVVKRAFRSPTKDSEKKSCRRREGNEQEEEEKQREKRRWLFQKPTNNAQQCEAKQVTNTTQSANPIMDAEQRHAIAVAAATAAAAEAAAATARAAVEIIRLTRPSDSVTEKYAATVIQTAFRGYLARTALRALKGLVKLQALVRGQNIRKQVKMTLKCMQALHQVQAQLHDQRARLSHELSRKSMFAEANNLWESRYLKDIRERKSISRDGSCSADHRNDRALTLQELEAILQNRKEVAEKHEKDLEYTFNQQIWTSDRDPYGGDKKEIEGRTSWLDRWTTTKQWESSGRASTHMKMVDIDTSKPCSCSTPNVRKLQSQNHQEKLPIIYSVASPRHRASYHQVPITPSPTKTKPLQVRSMSPRYLKEERGTKADTPSLGSANFFNGSVKSYSTGVCAAAGTTVVPNYMAATESAKARIRTQCASGWRASTPEKERGGSAKKRLSYPNPEPCNSFSIGYDSLGQNLRSPSFKSVQAGYVGMEQEFIMSSRYTDSVGGEISPCSTTYLRRWLR
ncbi:protein IQ-DOMAIN 17-like [Cornus florida]|uniref:protein IQ-DOMAIN 17-like n=1 Tax=Cornus florida TaxID=4283 RepID=UPI0028A2B3E6|nr:protein IQ-DOMAIN 17-like [Cornus florida]